VLQTCNFGLDFPHDRYSFCSTQSSCSPPFYTHEILYSSIY
jgi:hypothetical protein